MILVLVHEIYDTRTCMYDTEVQQKYYEQRTKTRLVMEHVVNASKLAAAAERAALDSSDFSRVHKTPATQQKTKREPVLCRATTQANAAMPWFLLHHTSITCVRYFSLISPSLCLTYRGSRGDRGWRRRSQPGQGSHRRGRGSSRRTSRSSRVR